MDSRRRWLLEGVVCSVLVAGAHGCDAGSGGGEPADACAAAACTGPADSSVDAGADDAGGDAGVDAGDRDAGPPGESCAAALPLEFSGLDELTAATSGDTSAYEADAVGACGGSGRDVVFRFTTTGPRDFFALITAGEALQPVLYLSAETAEACPGQQVACAASALPGTTLPLVQPALPAGTYFLWVDGNNGSSGTFALGVTLGPAPAGEDCLDPIPLDFSGGVTQRVVTGSTFAATNNVNSANVDCRIDGPDRVYTFTTNGGRSFVAEVTPTTPWDVGLVLRKAPCGSSGWEAACANASAAGSERISVSELTAGNWYLWVDGATLGDMGDYSLSVTLQ